MQTRGRRCNKALIDRLTDIFDNFSKETFAIRFDCECVAPDCCYRVTMTFREYLRESKGGDYWIISRRHKKEPDYYSRERYYVEHKK